MKKLNFDLLTQTVSYGNEKIRLTPPPVRKIHGERHEFMPLYDKKAAGWKSGCRLLRLQACECTFPGALVSGSVKVKMFDRWMMPERDFRVNEEWGTVGRMPDGNILAEEQVAISYSYYPSRIDTLFIQQDGSFSLKIGREGMAHPEIPAIPVKSERLANIFWHGDPAKLDDSCFYPVTERVFPDDLFLVENKPERTLQKLRSGEPVRILAWGDSVTQCSYLPGNCRWQEQFCRKLRQKFPQAQFELLTEAWGGRTTSNYFSVPPGEEHNFEEKVLAVKPDLIISEFVNDCGLPEAEFRANYQKIKAAFDRIGAEWIIMTPHYTTPAWMKIANSQNCDDDPRALVKFLREFSTANHIPLADAACYWGRLYRHGIAYETLFSNGINHPLEYGLSFFVEALMKLFA